MRSVATSTIIAMAVFFGLSLVWAPADMAMVSAIKTLVFGMMFGAIQAGIVIFGKPNE